MEFSKEVPEWLSIRVSKFDEDAKFIHLKHDFNTDIWRKQCGDLRDLKRNRMTFIEREIQDLYVMPAK